MTFELSLEYLFYYASIHLITLLVIQHKVWCHREWLKEHLLYSKTLPKKQLKSKKLQIKQISYLILQVYVLH